MPAAPARLKRRAEFLRVAAAGRKWATPGMIVQSRCRGETETVDASVRVGYTASRRVGNAVARNRARRRLRAVAAELLPELAAGHDYVLIARAGTLERPYGALRQDLRAALARLRRPGTPGGAAPDRQRR
jgi:ribonuclease P protein component